jgi:hypothetical protein
VAIGKTLFTRSYERILANVKQRGKQMAKQHSTIRAAVAENDTQQ